MGQKQSKHCSTVMLVNPETQEESIIQTTKFCEKVNIDSRIKNDLI